MLNLILFMCAMALQQVDRQEVSDGDPHFWRVNNQQDAENLVPGEAAGAVNLSFDGGQPGPRLGVALQSWGKTQPGNIVPFGSNYDPGGHFTLTGLAVGRKYRYQPAGPFSHLTGFASPYPGFQDFTATASSIILVSAFNAPVMETVIPFGGKPRAYGRFTAPDIINNLVGQATDNSIVITDDWRDGAGEDGGIGRAWRCLPGNAPQQIPLNGHDVWGTARLSPGINHVVMLRWGNERHYFVAADVDTTNSRLNLHCGVSWATGDLVLFAAATDGSAIYGTSPPNNLTTYYVKNITASVMELYTDAALTTKLSFTSTSPGPVGKFYLERRALSPGPYGNAAPPLLLQGTDTQSPFQVGFVAAPTSAQITSTTGAANYIVTAPNHNLVPGDAVLLTNIVDGSSSPISGTVYARPLSANTLTLYDTQIHSLGGGATGLQTLTASQTGSLKRLAASAMPMPGGTEIIDFLERKIILNGQNVMISDPNDWLHYTPLSATITANLGSNEPPTALGTLGYDTLLVFTKNTVLALQNLSQTSTNWVLTEITREYGCIAPLSVLHVGSDTWFLSRRGVASIQQTELGKIQGVESPVSWSIEDTIAEIDWINASIGCAAEWDNRVFFGVPLKGQALPGPIINNAVLAHNNLNRRGEEFAWEDTWNGATLTPVGFCRLTVFGEERLTFVNADGNVCWFSDDFTDMGAPINTQLTTRGYFGKKRVLALELDLDWDTFNPNLTITAMPAGANEQQVLASGFTYDRTKFSVYGQSGNDFSKPFRQDYSMVPDLGLYTPGVPFDLHQNHKEPFRMRVLDKAIQIVIANSQGSCRLNKVEVTGKALGQGTASEV